MRVYLAILEDRHIDDDIRVFHTLELAEEQIQRWKGEYDHVTDYETFGEGPLYRSVWQADEEQEEGLVLSIQEKEVCG